MVMLLMTLVGCSFSGAPSGAFPKQTGSFTLVDGPKAPPQGKEDKTQPTYYSEYLAGGDKLTSEEIKSRSMAQETVIHSVTPHASVDEAKKAFAEYKEMKQAVLRPSEGESIAESGSRLIVIHRGGMKTIVWVNNSWLCDVSSRNQNAVAQLADSLPYK